jgi:prepilin-type N-terminal cleavage/methylation domain-containing protein
LLGDMMRARTRTPGPRGVRGFSIIEIAISLAVLAVLATGILVPLVSQLQQRNVSVTEKTINDIKDALVGYAAVNGRLPCPATTSAATPGAEAFDTANAGGPANGRCESFWGYVPARTLGITPVDKYGFALDAWNNRIRYAVAGDTVGASVRPFTTTDGIRTATLPEVAKVASLLTVCDSGIGVTAGVSCNGARTLTANAAVVIWSIGANGATTGGNGADEAQNPNPRNETSADRLFVSHTASESATNAFDDLVNWIGINTLVNRMVGAGQLP